MFNGNNKTEEELDFAIKNGIGRISVDNFAEVDLISKVGGRYNKVIDVLLRITPGIECHTHEYIQTGQLDSKFGFDLSQIDDVITKIITEHQNIRIRGLHAHIGSQIFDIAPFEEAARVMLGFIADIKNADPDILLVALGVPKQEKWLYAHKQELNVPVSIGVGGSFDVMAGVMQRAPLWMQKAKLEWLFRGLKQPSRIGRLMALPKFVIEVMKSK